RQVLKRFWPQKDAKKTKKWGLGAVLGNWLGWELESAAGVGCRRPTGWLEGEVVDVVVDPCSAVVDPGTEVFDFALPGVRVRPEEHEEADVGQEGLAEGVPPDEVTDVRGPDLGGGGVDEGIERVVGE